MAVSCGGLHYPRSVGEFQAWFRTDANCLDCLEWMRWPQGCVCRGCGNGGGWRLGDGRLMCAACGHRTSVTAGTVFDRTRTLLTVWFMACWSFASAKDGISALYRARPARRMGIARSVFPARLRDVLRRRLRSSPAPRSRRRRDSPARSYRDRRSGSSRSTRTPLDGSQ